MSDPLAPMCAACVETAPTENHINPAQRTYNDCGLGYCFDHGNSERDVCTACLDRPPESEDELAQFRDEAGVKMDRLHWELRDRIDQFIEDYIDGDEETPCLGDLDGALQAVKHQITANTEGEIDDALLNLAQHALRLTLYGDTVANTARRAAGLQPYPQL